MTATAQGNKKEDSISLRYLNIILTVNVDMTRSFLDN